MKQLVNSLLVFLMLSMGFPAWSQTEVSPKPLKPSKEEEVRAEQFKRQSELIMKQAEMKAEQARRMEEMHAMEEQLHRRMPNPGGSSSELSLSKKFSGETVESKKSFEIQEDVSRISLSLTGQVKHGSIEVKIEKPNGKDFISVIIDNTSDVRWRQSLRISDENKELQGAWEITIKANKAEGTYNFRFTAE